MASFSPPTHFPATTSTLTNRRNPVFLTTLSHTNNFSPFKSSLISEAATEPSPSPEQGNGSVAAVAPTTTKVPEVNPFGDPRWVGGTWDLTQFQKNGNTDWDSVIDAEASRRKWLEDNPESSSNDNPVVFDTSIIPWWAWMKRFHLPEAEQLNGRAAMIGFFMAYFVDSLTGVGLVDQTNNFFCKTLLFVAVSGVLLIRKNEDIETLKKLWEETTFYDKQWQATWQDQNSNTLKQD
ncbi:light-harvesting complex-like protein 3 isotype 2, chloroplastic [Arachis hypogaea]|uniref:Lil3 protein n=2 Tax=Arachis hypogaea TaxID=3818 RepID=A0A444WUB3_ARAHY|nr:light-harvesting complex-like protein 3 isotype 1, chloroplastic [Arachis hypogaea]XP_025698409.1 light-harvesting complex-like protein 3 isotype 1, chloroplastic [Arachis hypogaea]QHO40455.1 Putative Lil3 protein [Arachis hypogaea]RYQ81057.1 hypothetical protein Ahy_Scaffold1g107066 [Arachis hypogaea]